MMQAGRSHASLSDEFVSDGAEAGMDHDGGSAGQSVLAADGKAGSTQLPPPRHARQQPRLPMEQVGQVNRLAQVQGSVSGIVVGMLSTLVSRRFLRISSKASFMTGLCTGVASSYMATWHLLQKGLRELEDVHIGRIEAASAPSRRRQKETDDGNTMVDFDLRAGQQMHHEGGVAGLYDFRDQTHSTRGDH